VANGRKLYGTTYEGGKHGYGTIFRLDTSYAKDKAGSGYKCLWGNFNDASDSNGGEPYFGALQVSANGKKLYGMTYEGGKHNYGVVYSIDTSGKNYKDLHDFKGSSSDGEYPYGSVTLNGGMLYGMTYEGSYWGYGTIFSLDTTGNNYNTLYAFTGQSNNGGYPYGDLTIEGNMMYGMTEDEGANGYGALFSIGTDGSGFQLLGSFDEYNTGGYPYGDLTVSNGIAYGVTSEYGDLYGGSVFKLDLCGFSPNTIATSSTPDNGTGNGTATANVTGNGPAPYTYMWSPGGQTGATASGLMAGSYTVNVTSANGCQNMETVNVGSSLGINNLTASEDISVYPNPSNGNITIALSGITEKSTVEVYNVMGQQVYTSALELGNNSIDLNTKSSGVYLYRIVTENGKLIGQGKLVIQK
jgi:uncharacterized repeat protein (TIGR03803 family)